MLVWGTERERIISLFMQTLVKKDPKYFLVKIILMKYRNFKAINIRQPRKRVPFIYKELDIDLDIMCIDRARA